MTLWNIIRDWFVNNVFGGKPSTGNIVDHNCIGNILYKYGDNVESHKGFTTNLIFNISQVNENGSSVVIGDGYLTLADWLSTTATIIVLCAMCFFLFLVVRWLFRLTSGLLSGRG